MLGVRGVGDEPRADGDVAVTVLHALEQPPQLVRRVLPVRVDAAAECIVAVARVAVTRGDRRLQTAVLAEQEHVGTRRARDVRSAVGRPVVDDEHVDVGELVVELA